MHEFSIATRILEQLPAHCPPGGVVRSVTIVAGPLRMIEPDALRMAWSALTAGTAHDGAALVFRALPPNRTCPDCGRHWIGGELIELCTCGGNRPRWTDADLLQIKSLEVEADDEHPIPEPAAPPPAATPPATKGQADHGSPRC